MNDLYDCRLNITRIKELQGFTTVHHEPSELWTSNTSLCHGISPAWLDREHCVNAKDVNIDKLAHFRGILSRREVENFIKTAKSSGSKDCEYLIRVYGSHVIDLHIVYKQ